MKKVEKITRKDLMMGETRAAEIYNDLVEAVEELQREMEYKANDPMKTGTGMSALVEAGMFSHEKRYTLAELREKVDMLWPGGEKVELAIGARDFIDWLSEQP